MGLVRAIQQRVRYPMLALRQNIQGQGLVQFVVAPNGQVRRIKIVRTINADFDSAVVQAMRQLPLLEPATQFGRPVACAMTAPLTFSISNPIKIKKAAPAADSNQVYTGVTQMPLYQGQVGFSRLAADWAAEYLRLRGETGCFVPRTNMGVLVTIGPSGRLYNVELSKADEQEHKAMVAEYGDAVAQREEQTLPAACVALLTEATQHLPSLVPAYADGKRVAMRVQLTLLAPKPD